MKKVALVFVLAVLAPSLVLAWLAVRSLRDQQLVIERQQALLYQGVSDALAREVDTYVADLQRQFGLQVEAFLGGKGPAPAGFDRYIATSWPLAEVGFVVSDDNRILAPQSKSSPEAQQFLAENGAFLTNREAVEVYNTSNKIGANNYVQQGGYSQGLTINPNEGTLQQLKQPHLAQQLQQAPAQQADIGQNAYPSTAQQARDSSGNLNQKISRAVKPQRENYNDADQADWSKVASTEADFRQLSHDSNEGAVARFLQNKLNVMLWYRSPQDEKLVFGAQVNMRQLIDGLRGLIQVEHGVQKEICAALLDDAARPVAVSHPGFQTNWKSPFVATEIGEVLPHWEIAVYLLDPSQLSRAARTLQFTLGLLIAVLLLAIGAGSYLIVSDLRRQLTLARQKTDFVSNVSHELKTPLTSIRMFSELLAEGRVSDEGKKRNYLQIISAEAARLTRLINNVLDFARLERGEKKYASEACDLVAVVRDTVETYRPHLESNGFRLECALPAEPVRSRGDCDALAQIVVNLISNAEKYANGSKEIRVEVDPPRKGCDSLEVRVLDRGPGVLRGYEGRIFEKFFRAADTLNSGIQGSGLGLTLARQIARAHGGDVTYRPREGGGSCFVLSLPVVGDAGAPV